jgi:hypothetical protein
MKRFVLIAIAVWGLSADAQANPPGPLDGQSIPANFAAAKRLGVQTNHTGVGDVTSLQPIQVFSPGSELDALYLAKDTNYLYVGLAGNLLEVGNPFLIFVDNPYDYGQAELWTEGVAGPPFALQMAGRRVVVSDNGTPDDPTDDTYTVVPNSGTQMPTCGSGFTGWDYALAVDTAFGTLYAHEYLLYSYPVGTASAADLCYYRDGRVPCDPTPGNPSDPALPLYAMRNLVASSPLNDGNETFEGGQPQFGYQRGGFDNTNTVGVTTTSATQAGTARKGLEIAIPLANIGDAGLYGDETIHLVILTMDVDEYHEYTVSGIYGSFMNQALPSLAGTACGAPQSLGLRPDLRTIASCLTVNLATLSYIGTSALLDGVIDPNDYSGDAAVLTQQCPTSGGDAAQLADVLKPVQNGSELDGLFAANDSQFLYLGLTGNLAAVTSALNVFVDADPGAGSHVLAFNPGPEAYTATPVTTFDNFNLSGTYGSWSSATITSGPASYRVQATGGFGGGYYDINPNVSLAGGLLIQLQVTLGPDCSPGGVLCSLVDEDITEHRWSWFGLEPGNSYTLTADLAHGDTVNTGSIAGLDLTQISFFHIQADMPTTDVTFEDLAILSVQSGVESILALNGNELPNGPLDALQAGFQPDALVGYDYAYSVNVSYTPHLASATYFDLLSSQYAFRGAVVPESGSAVLTDGGGLVARNPNGLQMAFNNWNTSGVLGCQNGSACFSDSAATVAALALPATTGMEMAIPLADLGLAPADLPRVVQLWTLVADRQGAASNQSLPSMRNATGLGNQVVNPGSPPVNFTNTASGATTGALLSDFSNFTLSATYGRWSTGTFTSGPTSFRVQSTDWGGGLYDLQPDVDATGATTMVLDFTFNPGNQADKLVVILVDADNTQRVYRFDDLATTGTYHLTRDLASFNNDNNPGTIPGLDLGHLAVFHIAGAYNHGNPGVPMDATFDNLQLLGGVHNYEARAARICLSTVPADADCNGRNDLLDAALLQRCYGMLRSPVFPMEAEQLDLNRDGLISFPDVQGLMGLIGGP